MNKKQSGGINIGTSSILVTFVLLCLVTFASLSYLTAKSDYDLSVQTAKRTAYYYDANRMAELYMANIEALLAKHASSCSNSNDYYSGIEGVFSDNSNILVEETSSDIVTVSYTIPVSESQNLCVRLVAHYPTGEDERLITVDKWMTVTNSEWIEKVREEERQENGSGLMF